MGVTATVKKAGAAARTALPLRVKPCAHEGPVREACTSCGNKEGRHVRACLHPDPTNDQDACTRQVVSPTVQACATCPDYRAYEPVARRHLAYHVYPVAASRAWRRGIDQLRMRWALFNGRKVVAALTGPGLASPEEVADYLPSGCELLLLPNDRKLREVASWTPLWERVLAGTGPGDAIFYAHAKAVTRPDDPGNSCHWWASLLYALSLDRWPQVAAALARSPVAGSFKKVGLAFDTSGSAWHYSGGFFWANAADFATRPWRDVPLRWWGTEAWPGLAYRPDEAGCVFHEGRNPVLDLYRPEYWRNVVRPTYAKWLAATAARRVLA